VIHKLDTVDAVFRSNNCLNHQEELFVALSSEGVAAACIAHNFERLTHASPVLGKGRRAATLDATLYSLWRLSVQAFPSCSTQRLHLESAIPLTKSSRPTALFSSLVLVLALALVLVSCTRVQ
jgi:hypothetical protein